MNLRELQSCGSCYTKVIKPGLCNYCQIFEDKCSTLLLFAQLILDEGSHRGKRATPISFRKKCICSVCKQDPPPRNGLYNNYMIFERHRDICKWCKEKETK